MDLVASSTRRPITGETLHGEDFQTISGGKGANQAVAAARLGAKVNMIGRVGDDDFGTRLQHNLKQEGIFLKGVEPVTDCTSGVAVITLAEGDNSIIVVAGANSCVTPDYVQKHRDLIAQSDIVLTQLEIPLETVEETAHICEKYHIPLVLNPAPAHPLSTSLVSKATFITPNQVEAQHLISQVEEDNIEALFEQWGNQLIMTDGKEGVIYSADGRIQRVPAYQVNPVDTTGAGDTFNGAFAYGTARSYPLERSCQFANAAASLSILKKGAQAGMPSKSEVEDFIRAEEEKDMEMDAMK
ncbi:ribokinase [Geomicrobium halophilum]|uniref:Deoxyribokinase n=2 Tax=Geomicrobium halophilum TaxID=549000 RepID=A0A841PXI8_9BACL|nr:ribokinase [Geomicrobium halophilum]